MQEKIDESNAEPLFSWNSFLRSDFIYKDVPLESPSSRIYDTPKLTNRAIKNAMAINALS